MTKDLVPPHSLVPVMAAATPPTTRLGDATPATNALAHCMVAHLRLEMIQEQNAQQTSKVDVAPFVRGARATFRALETIPQLRMTAGFRVLVGAQQTAQLIGTCVR